MKTLEQIKQALRTIIRNHKSFYTASKCRYCKDRMQSIYDFAWDYNLYSDIVKHENT